MSLNFNITITHTGHLFFSSVFSLVFFLLYSLIWGEIARTSILQFYQHFSYILQHSTGFREISNQYAVKSTLFLSPGNFLAEKFQFYACSGSFKNFLSKFFCRTTTDLCNFIFCSSLWDLQILISINNSVTINISNESFFPAFVLPIQNISHSAAASPIWIGPIHVLLSIAGFFRLDDKGKCLFITVIFTTLLPDLLYASEGIEIATGALREISFFGCYYAL